MKWGRVIGDQSYVVDLWDSYLCTLVCCVAQLSVDFGRAGMSIAKVVVADMAIVQAFQVGWCICDMSLSGVVVLCLKCMLETGTRDFIAAYADFEA